MAEVKCHRCGRPARSGQRTCKDCHASNARKSRAIRSEEYASAMACEAHFRTALQELARWPVEPVLGSTSSAMVARAQRALDEAKNF